MNSNRVSLGAADQHALEFCNDVPVGYCITGETGVVVQANLALATLLGVPQRALVAQPFAHFIVDDDEVVFSLLGKHAFAAQAGSEAPTAQANAREVRLKRSDGTLLWAEIVGKAATADGGERVLHLVVTESTARRDLEAKLAEADALLERICQAAKIGSWELEPRTNDVRYSKAAALIFELEPFGVEVIEKFSQARNYYPPAVWSALQVAIQDGTPYDMETPIITAKGRRRWVWMQGVVAMQDGVALKLLGTVKDITLRSEAAEHVAATRNRLQATLDAIPDLLFEVSESGHLLGYHAHRADLLAAPPEVFLGKTFSEVLPLAAAEVCMSALREAAITGWSVGGTYSLALPRGETWFEVSVAGRADTGTAELTFILLARDVTARKAAEAKVVESEARFRQLAEHVEDLFWVSDPVKRELLYVSPAYERIWGRASAELYRDPSTWLATVHPEDRARVEAAAATNQVLGLYDETYRIQRPDGAVRWIHARAFPVVGPTGEVPRVVGVARDVTTQTELQNRLLQSQKLQAVGSLAAGIAHDFNNVLAVVLAHADLALSSMSMEHPARENLTQIAQASAFATSLVLQLLTFSRQERVALAPVALAPLLEASVKFLRAIIPATVEVVVSVPADAPTVLADPAQLQQVLINLCTNAYHALPTGPGRIEVKVESVTLNAAAVKRFTDLRPGCFACLSVTDNGAGMDAATLSRIFDPFFTTKEQGKGTGLGLSVVHGIVKGHGGAIDVVSQLGHGTIFRLYLPAMAAELAPAVDVPHGQAPAESSTAVGRYDSAAVGAYETILLVDDQPGLRKALAAALTREGYRVLCAGSAAEAQAVAQASAESIQLLVTDVVMPGMNGVELAKALRTLRPQLKVLFLSGYPADVVTQQGWLEQGTPYLAKPCPTPKLIEQIRALLGEAAAAGPVSIG